MTHATQIKNGLTFATVFCGKVADRLTSRPAMRFYAKVWKQTVLCTQAVFAISLILGYAAFILGYNFRDGVEAHNAAIDAFVQRHLVPTIEVQAALMPAVELVALPPVNEFEEDVWAAAIEALRTLITPGPMAMFQMLPALPPAKIEATIEVQKPRRKKGRGKR